MKNKYEIRGEVTAIFIESPKYGKLETLISTNKLDRAKEFPNTWFAVYSQNTNSFYANGRIKKNKTKTTHSIHRWISNAEKNILVDHIDHNTLDNRDENLRIATPAENMQNRKSATSKSKSGVRGVCWYEARGKWIAYVGGRKNRIHVGYFDDIKEAEIAVKEARAKLMPYSREALAN